MLLAPIAVAILAPRAPDAVLDLVMVGRSPAVRATVDGHPATLTIDTGSFELRLDEAYARREGLTAKPVELRLGGLSPIKTPAYVERLEGDAPAAPRNLRGFTDGIVGLDVLRRFALGLDLAKGKVAFWSGGRLKPDDARAWAGPNPVRLPLTTFGANDWYRVGAQIGRHPVEMLLDTGTAFSTVNPSLARKLSLRMVGETVVQEIGRTERLKVAVAPSLSFGSIAAEFPVMNVESVDDPGSSGILGLEALGTGRFLIDMPGLSFWAVRVAALPVNPLQRRLREAGLDFFMGAPGELRVLVRPGSRAAGLGIDSGDRLLSLGGVPVADLFAFYSGDEATPEQLQTLLRLGIRALSAELPLQIRLKNGRETTITLPKPVPEKR